MGNLVSRHLLLAIRAGAGSPAGYFLMRFSRVQIQVRFGPLSIDWTARIEKIMQLDRTFVRIQRV